MRRASAHPAPPRERWPGGRVGPSTTAASSPLRALRRLAVLAVGSTSSLVACNSLTGADAFDVLATEPPDAAAVDPAPAVAEPDEPEPAVVDAGAEEDGPPPAKRVFVTKAVTTGVLGGRAGADALCAEAAKHAKLEGQWVAWLSTQKGAAIERIEHPGRYELLDGTEVVAARAQLLSGTIAHAIDMTEDGVTLSANQGVWTGTAPNGEPRATCHDWTSDAHEALGTMASAVAHDGGWTKGGAAPDLPEHWRCDALASLYCFER